MLGLITCGVILATVAKIGQAVNVFSFVSPILMVIVLIGAATKMEKADKFIDIIKKKPGKALPEGDEIKSGFKPATYSVLNVLYLSIVLLFAAYGYFLNALFWLVIWAAAAATWTKHRKLYGLYKRTTRGERYHYREG